MSGCRPLQKRAFQNPRTVSGADTAAWGAGHGRCSTHKHTHAYAQTHTERERERERERQRERERGDVSRGASVCCCHTPPLMQTSARSRSLESSL
eukprot:1641115-Rhodomonas_salina.1